MKIFYAIAVASIAMMPLQAGLGKIYKLNTSVYATTIAHKVGDILSVKVIESANTVNDANENTTRDSSHVFELAKLFLPSFDVAKGFSQTIGSGTSPGINFSNKSSIKNDGKNTSKHTFTATIPVRLIEEVTEGQFVVRGHRMLNINGKKKNLFLSGVIRQEDITSANEIDSSKIVEAVVEIDGDIVAKELGPGVLSKIYNYIF